MGSYDTLLLEATKIDRSRFGFWANTFSLASAMLPIATIAAGSQGHVALAGVAAISNVATVLLSHQFNGRAFETNKSHYTPTDAAIKKASQFHYEAPVWPNPAS